MENSPYLYVKLKIKVMSSILNSAKQHLIETAVSLYLDRRSEIDFEEYPDHFKDLGFIISDIDKIETFSELITELEKGKFEVLGFFTSDVDMIENFIDNIRE